MQITQFLLDHDIALEGNILNSSDWELLSRTHAFLQPFASATLYAEGSNASISQTLILMDALLLHYKQAKVYGLILSSRYMLIRQLATILRV